MINDNVKGHASIGRIDVLPNFSFFEVEEKSARNIIGSLKNINFFGKRVSVEPADKKVSFFFYDGSMEKNTNYYGRRRTKQKFFQQGHRHDQ